MRRFSIPLSPDLSPDNFTGCDEPSPRSLDGQLQKSASAQGFSARIQKMSGLVEYAEAILGGAQRKLDVTSRNVANMSTPGYKRSIAFSDALVESLAAPDSAVGADSKRDFAQASISVSRNPYDLAISGDGFFQLRNGDQLLYSRQGQFHRAADGSVVNGQGMVLQQAGGGDLVLGAGIPVIAEDGSVLEDGRPVARLAILRPEDSAGLHAYGDSLFSATAAMTEASSATVRQGALENSNVVLGEEMVTMMGAMRQAESGARLVQVYDQLIDRAITTFGQGGK